MAKEHELKSHISSAYDKINAVSVENFNLLREKLGSTSSVVPTYPLSAQIALLSTLNVLDTKLPNTLETSVMELPLSEAESIEEISGGVYGNGMYVAITDCNSDIVLVSTTGQKWKKIHTGLKGYRNQICYVNGYFVTASYDEMWYEYSKDGITWVRKQLTFIPSYICATDNTLYFISVTDTSSKYTIKVQYTTNIETPVFKEITYAVPEYITGDYNNNSNRCIVLSNTHIVLLGNSSCISIVKSVTGFTLQQIAVNMLYALPIILKSDDGIRKGILYRYTATDTLMYIKLNGQEVSYNCISVDDVNITKDTIAIMLDRAWDETNDTGYMVINKDAVYTNTKLLKTNLYEGSRDFSGDGWEKTKGVTIIPNAYNGLSAYNSTVRWQACYKVINAVAGERYRFSCYVKTTDKDTTVMVPRLGEDTTNTGKVLYLDGTHRQPSANNTWVHTWITFEVSASGTIRPACFSTKDGVEYSVCGMVLEKLIGDGSSNVFKDPINYDSNAWNNRSTYTIDTEKYNSLTVLTKSRKYSGLTQTIDATIGEQYRITAYVKATQPNSVQFTTNSGVLGTGMADNTGISDRNINATMEWKKFSYEFTVTKSGTLRPAVESRVDGVQYWITGITLEKISQMAFTTNLTESICIYGEHSFILPKKNFTKVNIVEYISKKSLVDDTSDMYTMSLDDSIRNIPLMLENIANGYDRKGYYRVANGNFTVSSGAFIDIVLPTKAEMLLIYAKSSTAKTYFVKVINEEGQFQNYLYDANQDVLGERRAEVIRQDSGKYVIGYDKETKIVDNGFHFVNTSEFTEFAYVAICSKISNASTVEEPSLEPFEVLTMKDVTYNKVLCVRDDLVIGCSVDGRDLILSYDSSSITKNIIPAAETVKITSAICTKNNKVYIGTNTNRIYVGTIIGSNTIDNLSVYTLPTGASIKFFGSIVYNNETVLFAVGPDMTQIYYKTLNETAWTKYTGYTDAKTLKEVVSYEDTLYLIPTSSKYIITIRKGSTGYVASTVNVATEDISWGGCIVNSSMICMVDNTSTYLYSTEKGTSSAFKKSTIGTYDTTFVRGMYINGLYYIFLKDSKLCYGIYSSNLQNWTNLEIIDKALYSNVRMSLDTAWYTNNYFILSMLGNEMSLSMYEGTNDFSGTKWVNKSLYTLTPNGYMKMIVATSSHQYSGLRQKINTLNGELYQFTAYVKTTSNNIFFDGIPSRNSVSESASYTVISQKQEECTDGWVKYIVQFKITENGFIEPTFHKSSADTVPYSICGISLEKLPSMYEVHGARVDKPITLCVNGVELRNKVVHRLNNYGDTAKLTFYNYQTKTFIPLSDITNLHIIGDGATLSNGIITFTTVGTTVIYYTYNGVNYTNIIAYRPIPTEVRLTLPDRPYLPDDINIAVQPFPTNTAYANLTGNITKGNADIRFETGNVIITPKQTGLIGGRIYMNLENGTQIWKDFELAVYEKVYPSDISVVYSQTYIHAGTSITPKITYTWPKSGEYVQQMVGTEISLTAPSDIIDKVRIDSNGKLTLDNFDFSVSKPLVVTVKTLNNITKQISINTVKTISNISLENDLLITSAYEYPTTGVHRVDIEYTPTTITEPDLVFISTRKPSSGYSNDIPYGTIVNSFSNGKMGVDIHTQYHAGDGTIDIYTGPKNPNSNKFMKRIHVVYPHIRWTNIVNSSDNLFTSLAIYHICPLDETLLVLIAGTGCIFEVSKIDYTIIRRITLPSKISPVVNRLFYLDGTFILTSEGFTTDSAAIPPTGHGQLWVSTNLTDWSTYDNLAPLFGENMTVNRIKIIDKKLIFLCTGRMLYCKIDWDSNAINPYPTCGSLSSMNKYVVGYEWIDCAIGSKLVFLSSDGSYVMASRFGVNLTTTVTASLGVQALDMKKTGRIWKAVGYLKQAFIFLATDGSMEVFSHHLNNRHVSLAIGLAEQPADITDMTLINCNNSLFMFIAGANSNRNYYHAQYYPIWGGFTTNHGIVGKNSNLALSDGKVYSIHQDDNIYNETNLISLCQAYYSSTIPSKLLETGRTFTKCIYMYNMYIAISGKRVYVCNDNLITYFEHPDDDISEFDDIYAGVWLSDVIIYSYTSRTFIVLNIGLTQTIDLYVRKYLIANVTGIDIARVYSAFYNGAKVCFSVITTKNELAILYTSDYQIYGARTFKTAPNGNIQGVFTGSYGAVLYRNGINTSYALSATNGEMNQSVTTYANHMLHHLPNTDLYKLVYGNKLILVVFEKSMMFFDTVTITSINVDIPYNIKSILYETATYNCGIYAVLAKSNKNEDYLLISKDCQTWTRRKLENNDAYISLMILPNNTIHAMNKLGKIYKYKLSYNKYRCIFYDNHQLGSRYEHFGLPPTAIIRRIKNIEEFNFVMFKAPNANTLMYVTANMMMNAMTLPASEEILDVFAFQTNYVIATKTTMYYVRLELSGNLGTPVNLTTTSLKSTKYIEELLTHNIQVVDSVVPGSAKSDNHGMTSTFLHAVCKKSDGTLVYKSAVAEYPIPGNAAYSVKILRESGGHNDLILTRDANADYLIKHSAVGHRTHLTYAAGEILDFATINDSIVLLSNQNKIIRYPINMDWNMGTVYWLPENVVSKDPKLLVDDSRFILCASDVMYTSFDGISWEKEKVEIAVDNDPYSNYVVLGDGVMQKWSFNTTSGYFYLTYISRSK